MVRTTIDNVHRRFYIRMLVTLVVLTAIVATGIHLYYGSSVEKGHLDLEDGLHLGDTFTVDEVVENSGYGRMWIKDGTAKVNVYYIDSDGNEVLTDGLISYDSSSRTFKVKGVSCGRMEFVNPFDHSVSYSVTFRTGFSSTDTQHILQSNNCVGRGALSSGSSEQIYLEDDLSGIRYLNLSSDEDLDLKDMGVMPALNRISILGDICASYRNVELPDTINLYVDSAVYGEYQDEGSAWRGVRDRVFLDEGLDRYSIMFELNGGSSDHLAEDHLYTSLVRGESLSLAVCPVPELVGYTFGGWWVSTDGGRTLEESLADGSIPDRDLKLYARWLPVTFTLRFHSNFGEDQVNDFVMVYDETTLDAGSMFSAEGYTLAGWSRIGDSVEPEMPSDDDFRNHLHTDGAIADLYAVWHKDVYSIRFLNEDGTVFVSLSGCRLGDGVTLPSSKPVNAQAKSFVGWVLDPELPDVSYPAGSTMSSFHVLPGMGGTVDLHPLFSSTTYTVQLYLNGGTSQGATLLEDIPLGEDLVLTLPDKLYNRFEHWIDADGNEYRASASDLQNGTMTIRGGVEGSFYVKLTACFVPHSFKVSLAGTIKTVTMGKTNTLPTVSSTVGYTTKVSCPLIIGSWSSGGTLSTTDMQNLYKRIRGDVTDNQFDESKTVQFEVILVPRTYTVTYSVSVSPSSKTVTFGSTYGSLPVPDGYTVDEGDYHVTYGFSKWTYNEMTISSDTVVTTASDHRLIAHFKEVAREKKSCVAPGTEFITENGVVPVENLGEGDRVLAFDHVSGEFEFQPISFLTVHPGETRTLDLLFDNGAHLEMAYEHGLFDMGLNRYVMVNESNVESLLGHRFAYMDESGDGPVFVSVVLTGYRYGSAETVYSLLTAYDICSVNNGLLSMPADIDGLYNMFEFGPGLAYDGERMAEDIETYGYLEYEPYSEYLTREEFEMFGAQYLSVSLGKGLTTMEGIMYLIETYLLGGYLEWQ